MGDHGGAANPVAIAVTVAIVLLVLSLRLRGLRRSRPLKIEQLWIVPAIYAVIATVVLVEAPPTPIGWVLCLVGLAAGAALGWQRGRMMRIEVDPETHALNQQASPAALFFIIALIVVRSGARGLAESGALGGMHLSALLITDVLVMMALGLLATQRIEMYLRARRLLDAARGQPA